MDALIVGEIEEINALIYEEALKERQEAAADPAAFSPSGMSRLRRETDAQEGQAPADDQDNERSGQV